MTWRLEFTEKSLKQLKKMDSYTRVMIFNWLEKNINGCENPRLAGKSLKGNLAGLWRYRIGDYRIICQLKDDECIVLALNAGHRREIYR